MNRKRTAIIKNYTISIFLLMMTWMGCASIHTLDDPPANATLWMQNSAEYKALTTMIYQSAGARLEETLQNDAESADLEQEKGSYRSLPPAIIVDVDETALNNSPFQARLIKQNENYSPEKWNAWVREEKADAISVAVSFTQKWLKWASLSFTSQTATLLLKKQRSTI